MKHKIITGAAIIAGLFIQIISSAQTLVPPTLTDNLWLTTGITMTGINTALIDILGTNDENSNYPIRQLAACAYGGTGGGVIVTDFRTGISMNTAIPATGGSGYTVVGTPDVILGNKSGSSIDFIMAVAFINSSLPAYRQLEIDYFDIHYVTSTAFTVALNSYQVLSLPNNDTLLGTVHIDVVAQSSVPTSLTGSVSVPYCDKFFVTYDMTDTTTGARIFKVYATYGSLNAYNYIVAGPQVINEAGACFALESWQPDVAGIERQVGLGTYHNIACLTYVFAGNHALFYSEWDPAGTACSGTGRMNYTTLYSIIIPPLPVFKKPRIDANDDYGTNSSVSCQSKVACEYYPPLSTIPQVRIFSPLLAASPGITTSWIDVSTLPGGPWPAPPGYYNYAPAVAFGQNGRTEFMVTECTNIPGTGDFFVMSPIDKLNSGSCTAPGGSLSLVPGGGANDYFEVNATYPASSSNSANSVSTPCNFVTDTSVVAWTHNSSIYYKRCGYNPTTGSTGYAYRTTPAITTNVIPFGKLTIYPNPTESYIIVNNPASNAANSYSIKNVLGQVVSGGNIVAGEQQLSMERLTAGNYLISFYKDGAPIYNKILVKK